MLLGLTSLILAIKGFGGSFNRLLTNVGAGTYHGPIVASVIAVTLVAFFLKFRSEGRVTEVAGRSKFLVGLAFLLLVMAATFVRVRAIRSQPIDYRRADMLYTVTTMIDDFVRGNDPYQPKLFPDGNTVPRYYLPALWLSYLPFHIVLGDVRWLNLLAHLLFYILLFDTVLHHGGGRRSWLVFLAVVGLHAFSKQAVKEVVDIQTGPFWLGLSCTIWALNRGYFRLALGLVPYICGVRHSAPLLFLPLFVWCVRSGPRRLSTYIPLLVVSFLLILFAMPFLPGILRGIPFYTSEVNELPVNLMLGFFGLAGVLKDVGLLWLQPWLQFLFVALGLVIAITRRDLSVLEALALGGVSYTGVMLFVGSSFAYLYAEPIILVCFLILRCRSPRG